MSKKYASALVVLEEIFLKVLLYSYKEVPPHYGLF
jgi:hypothetical protein